MIVAKCGIIGGITTLANISSSLATNLGNGDVDGFLSDLLFSAGATVVVLALFVSMLHALPHMGEAGRNIAQSLTRAPSLDAVVAVLTWLPWVVGAAALGWAGLLGIFGGQVIVLQGWIVVHETSNRQARRGPRIVKFINRRFGRWRNHFALWVTIIALPGFWLIRLLQITAYPWLVWVLGFPRYRNAEWINVSRQKFQGLIGHDLIWCLYCDWMTGVYALGGEMLRNVESFWCPIRFYDGKKCDNCKIDFPDIDGGWVPADGSMHDVEEVMQQMYAEGKPAAWFGHPARLTIQGQPIGETQAAGSSEAPIDS